MLVAVLVTVGVATAATFLIVVVGLVRRLHALAVSVEHLNDELQPLVEEIRTESERARDHLERQRTQVERPIGGRSPGAR